MHYLVRLVIEGDNIETVMDQAGCVMGNLVEQREFDWYRTEDDNCAWADCWKPVPLDSDTGIAWVKDAIDAQFSEFKHSMQAIRYMVQNYSDEQIFDEDFGDKPEMHLSRYYFSKASGYHANTALLYDTYGTAIPNNTDLMRCIDESMKHWVIQVDCHN